MGPDVYTLDKRNVVNTFSYKMVNKRGQDRERNDLAAIHEVILASRRMLI